jgi:hypothetical protein
MTLSGTTPLFATHHAFPGAFASLTFGQPGSGAGIEIETTAFREAFNLLVACSHGPGRTFALPFMRDVAPVDTEAESVRLARAQAPDIESARWRCLPASEVERTLSLGVDTYRHGGFTFRVWTPRQPLPEPARLADPGSAAALCPALLLELTLDNRDSDTDATIFLGLASLQAGLRFHPLAADAEVATLCGIGFADAWCLAAFPEPGVFTIKDYAIARAVEEGRPCAEFAGAKGGVARRVPAGSVVSLTCALGIHRPGSATRNPATVYAYTRHFHTAEAAAGFALAHAEAFRATARAAERSLEASACGAVEQAMLAQAVSAYEACSQLTVAPDGAAHYAVMEGQYAWRNTFDLAIDHLAWELHHNPWTALAVLESHIDGYSYRDEIDFPEAPGVWHAGGISFAHDQGLYLTYAPKGRSGYERAGLTGCYGFMTTEQLLNGAMFLAGVLQRVELAPARRERLLRVAHEVMESLERRDHVELARRDGLLKARSSRCGETGQEINSYDSLGHYLTPARGSAYLAVKTWVACLALTRIAPGTPLAARARTMADLTAGSLLRAFDPETGLLPGNLNAPSDERVLVSIESLGTAATLGIADDFGRYPELIAALRRHALACLQPGFCLRETPAGPTLLLASASHNTWPSKLALCLLACSRHLGIDVEANQPGLSERLRVMFQDIPGTATLSDQIDGIEGKVLGGSYYPRMVSLAYGLKPPSRALSGA